MPVSLATLTFDGEALERCAVRVAEAASDVEATDKAAWALALEGQQCPTALTTSARYRVILVLTRSDHSGRGRSNITLEARAAVMSALAAAAETTDETESTGCGDGETRPEGQRDVSQDGARTDPSAFWLRARPRGLVAPSSRARRMSGQCSRAKTGKSSTVIPCGSTPVGFASKLYAGSLAPSPAHEVVVRMHGLRTPAPPAGSPSVYEWPMAPTLSHRVLWCRTGPITYYALALDRATSCRAARCRKAALGSDGYGSPNHPRIPCSGLNYPCTTVLGTGVYMLCDSPYEPSMRFPFGPHGATFVLGLPS